MQAYIFALVTPLLPLLLRKLYKKEESLDKREFFIRYVVNTLLMTIFATVVMVFLCDDNTSFLEKVDASPLFALKFLAVELMAAALVAAADWIYETKSVTLSWDKSSFAEHPVTRAARLVAPFVLYLFAAVVILLNVQLIFDNVLWGDEAFSANLVRNDFGGIMQVLTLVENHPPLYYYWLKLWVMIFGESGPVYHAASVALFAAGIVMAVTLVRKHYGKVPAAIFLVISGLSASCVEYNVEVRMYAMAFLGLAYCYYCSARILKENRPASWVGMVLWGAIAAYAHYYALMSAVILMVAACLFAVKRFGKKTWVRVLAAGAAFILIYLPWLGITFRTAANVTRNWWVAVSATPKECIAVIFGGDNMSKWSLPLWFILFIVVLLAESSVLEGKKQENRWLLNLRAPSSREWSAELCTLVVGVIAIAGTLLVGELSIRFTALVLARRYIYPLAAVAAMMLVIVCSHSLHLLKELEERVKITWLAKAGKCLLVVVILLMVTVGYRDYRDFSEKSKTESAMTEEVLGAIGESAEGMVLVNNGVTHIGWTVLQYYYPDAEIVNGRIHDTDAEDFWYFTANPMTQEEITALGDEGTYLIAGYPSMQLVKYPLSLYHFIRDAK